MPHPASSNAIPSAPAGAHRPPEPGPAPGPPPERRHTPAAARGPYFGSVCAAWRRAREAHDPYDPGLGLALAAYARDGRARGVPVATLLRALDTVVCPARGGDPALDFGHAREIAGTLLIRSYYRGD